MASTSTNPSPLPPPPPDQSNPNVRPKRFYIADLKSILLILELFYKINPQLTPQNYPALLKILNDSFHLNARMILDELNKRYGSQMDRFNTGIVPQMFHICAPTLPFPVPPFSATDTPTTTTITASQLTEMENLVDQLDAPQEDIRKSIINLLVKFIEKTIAEQVAKLTGSNAQRVVEVEAEVVPENENPTSLGQIFNTASMAQEIQAEEDENEDDDPELAHLSAENKQIAQSFTMNSTIDRIIDESTTKRQNGEPMNRFFSGSQQS